MAEEVFDLPAKAFFSCEQDGFSVADGSLMSTVAGIITIEPLLKLRVGSGNIFEQRPVRMIERVGDIVTVECESDVTVVLDFGEFAARVKRPDGEFYYMGALDEGNDGLGFMAAR
jgi:hypothetical protein